MNVKEALHVLSERDITHSEQMVRRWIRNGKLKATMNSKREGYEIDKLDLFNFIWKRDNENNKGKTHALEEYERNRELEKKMEKMENDHEKAISRYIKLSEVHSENNQLLKRMNAKLQNSVDSLSLNQSTNVNTLFGDEAETKKTFRTMLNKMHPDNNNGNDEAFKKINKLYKETFR